MAAYYKIHDKTKWKFDIELSYYLKIIREGADINQFALAKMIGKSREWVCRVESGDYQPSMEDLESWCLICGTCIDDAFLRCDKSISKIVEKSIKRECNKISKNFIKESSSYMSYKLLEKLRTINKEIDEDQYHADQPDTIAYAEYLCKKYKLNKIPLQGQNAYARAITAMISEHFFNVIQKNSIINGGSHIYSLEWECGTPITETAERVEEIWNKYWECHLDENLLYPPKFTLKTEFITKELKQKEQTRVMFWIRKGMTENEILDKYIYPQLGHVVGKETGAEWFCEIKEMEKT